MIEIIVVTLIGYLIGSIPFGLVLTKFAGYGDIRTIGSGNIGATNVLRTGNKWLALATLILDGGKGFFVIFAIDFATAGFTPPWFDSYRAFFGENFRPFALLSVGAFIILGHVFPVWLKFKGGKGVATTLGTLLAAVPYTGIAACLAWIASAFAFRISSLAALIAMGVAPIITFILYGPLPAVINLAISLLVVFRHKDNIQRLLKGEEPKIGKKKTTAINPLSPMNGGEG